MWIPDGVGGEHQITTAHQLAKRGNEVFLAVLTKQLATGGSLPPLSLGASPEGRCGDAVFTG